MLIQKISKGLFCLFLNILESIHHVGLPPVTWAELVGNPFKAIALIKAGIGLDDRRQALRIPFLFSVLVQVFCFGNLIDVFLHLSLIHKVHHVQRHVHVILLLKAKELIYGSFVRKWEFPKRFGKEIFFAPQMCFLFYSGGCKEERPICAMILLF